MSDQKILSLLKKLRELSERGVDGERDTAERMLNKLLLKHGMTLEMIEGEEKRMRWFKAPSDLRQFMGQISSSVTGTAKASYYTSAGQRGKIGFKLTDSEYLELLAKYEFYLPRYKEEVELFYSAFIQKNKLYRKATEDERDSMEDEPITPEERARLWKMAQMMQGMETHQFKKTLNSGK